MRCGRCGTWWGAVEKGRGGGGGLVVVFVEPPRSLVRSVDYFPPSRRAMVEGAGSSA